MRIVIDMQGAQTESRFRGIGRYTLAFAQGVARNRGEHDIILVLSGLFPDTIEPIRQAFEGVLPQENIRVWYAPGPVLESQPGNETRREVAELIREAFLASLQADVIHITSLVEGHNDDAVTSIGAFDNQTPVTVSFYDLIPLLNPDQYLKSNPTYARHYQRKVGYLQQAASLLAISEFSRQEGIDTLGLPEVSVVNVSTACDDCFKSIEVDSETAGHLKNTLGIAKPFILYTGGPDERKNLPRLIEAYARLPTDLRQNHQLVFAGKMLPAEVERFRQVANTVNLADDELVITGYITDEQLVQLYNLCRLYVFPSWHEGFGLPALEAMACGTPVIGSNATSLPEVIGLTDALFDPFDVDSIAQKILQALTDEIFHQQLCDHARQQVLKFSWDKTAQRSIDVWQQLQAQDVGKDVAVVTPKAKPRLAFVSPLPPERTGIADYSAELLPALAAYYDIDLVIDQPEVGADFLSGNDFTIRDVAWLRSNAGIIDRVIYQVGNSPFHKHMLELVRDVPGTVVLHDFYASGLMAWLEQHGGLVNAWSKELYSAHGYQALADKYSDPKQAMLKYPANWGILQYAEGIIVHSHYSRNLAQQWFGRDIASRWQVIPLLRSPGQGHNTADLRKQLNIAEDDFVVCSFGFVDATKMHHRLLDAWLRSSLAEDKRCHLIFVGDNQGGAYGKRLLSTIQSSSLSENIKITGFLPTDNFHQYLAAADMAVQLRTQSRGETSAAALDCMNYGLPLIVNANGSMAELDAQAVWMLPNEFDDDELVAALEELRCNAPRREAMGKRAKDIIREHHSPEKCAEQYAQAIEEFCLSSQNSLSMLINKIAKYDGLGHSDLIDLSQDLAKSISLPRPAKCLFLDITATCSNNLKTGIERVARALAVELIKSPPAGYRVEPVYLSKINDNWQYVYARQYTSGILDIPDTGLTDEVADIAADDMVLGLDISGSAIINSVESGYIDSLRRHGVCVYFIVFDLLPIRMPEVFPAGSEETHARWLKAIASTDGVIGISKHVADDLSDWLAATGLHKDRQRSFSVNFFHLGADLENSAPSKGIPVSGKHVIEQLQLRSSFLMVGTIEPRKGHAVALSAFELMWQKGIDVNLVIVGKEGWVGLPDDMRGEIQQTMKRLRNHPENGKRLLLLEGISDDFLGQVYANSTCLLAASYDEGFGLPLIEAAQHCIPIIARDIPVFHEVAGKHAFYFNSKTPEALAESIQQWLALYHNGTHPRSDNLPWLTWQDSAQLLKKCLFDQAGSGTSPR